MKKSNQTKSAIAATTKALEELEIAVEAYKKSKGEEKDIFRDAMIKRFEVTFEYCWKMFKACAEYEGSEAPGPRQAISEARRYGWIADLDFWALALDARNGSVHDYFGITYQEYFQIILRFVKELSPLLHKLAKN